MPTYILHFKVDLKWPIEPVTEIKFHNRLNYNRIVLKQDIESNFNKC